MQVIVNGKETTLPDECTASNMLDFLGYKQKMIVIERNYEIIPKEEFDNAIIKENDSIEIISFVGGG